MIKFILHSDVNYLSGINYVQNLVNVECSSFIELEEVIKDIGKHTHCCAPKDEIERFINHLAQMHDPNKFLTVCVYDYGGEYVSAQKPEDDRDHKLIYLDLTGVGIDDMFRHITLIPGYKEMKCYYDKDNEPNLSPTYLDLNGHLFQVAEIAADLSSHVVTTKYLYIHEPGRCIE